MKRKELLDAMKAVSPAIDSSDGTVAGTDSFIFDGDWIRTHDDQLSVSYPFHTGLTATVRAKEFHTVLNRMKTKEISLTGNEGQVIVEGGKTTLEMNVLEDDSDVRSLVASMKLDDVEFTDLPADFKDALMACAPAMSSSAEMGYLNGLAVCEDLVVAADDFRISLYELEDTLGDDVQLDLPYEGVNGLLNALDKPIGFSAVGGWCHFLDESGAIFSTRLLGESYPVEKVLANFPEEADDDTNVFPEELVEALGRAAVLATDAGEDELPYITITAEKKELILTGSKEIGKITERVPNNKVLPEGTQIKTAPGLLTGVLKRTREFVNVDGRLIFVAGPFSHLIAAHVA